MQYVCRVRNESRTHNKLDIEQKIILYFYSHVYRKMINNIENIFDWIFKQRFHQIVCLFYFCHWKRARKYVVQESKQFYQIFHSILSLHTRTSIYYLIENCSTKKLIQRSIARRRFCVHLNRKNATSMQQISFKSNDEHRRRQKTKHIVRRKFVICIIQILWLRMNNEFCRHEFSYNWNMRHATNFA